MSENLKYWNKLKTVPPARLKTIQGGRLKGKSDINPQWRYEILTEIFGICGIGWKYTIDKKWIETGSENQQAAFVDISLYVKIDNEWSEAIPANGGSMFVEKESSGLHTSDECFKMATTDALGTAAKMLGVAAEVYMGKCDTKYTAQEQRQNAQPQAPQKPWLNPNTEAWTKVVAYLKGSGTIAEVKTKYNISKENEQKLMEEAI